MSNEERRLLSSGTAPTLLFRLDSLPEIEREDILASRQEEMQKYKDSMQLDAMYKMAVDVDDDDDDSHHHKRRECFLATPLREEDYSDGVQASTPVSQRRRRARCKS